MPKTENEVNKVLNSLSTNKYTQVFFIPSIKVNFYIKKFKQYYGDRKILIAKELTKIHEEFFRDQVKNLKIFKNSFKR